MFIEFIQYSLETIRVIVKNFVDDRKTLPITINTNRIKCLDFDIDNVIFINIKPEEVKIAEVIPYKRSAYDMMEAV